MGGTNAAIEKTKDSIGAGYPLRGFEVDDACRGFIQSMDSASTSRIGHSIGQEVQRNGPNIDNLETHDERRVSPWTCFSTEPGVRS